MNYRVHGFMKQGWCIWTQATF